MKTHTTITIESDLLKRAKNIGVNMSEVATKGIEKALGIQEVKIEESDICEFCKQKGVRETRDTINSRRDGLTWLYPDEMWICNRCLRTRINEIEKGIATRSG